MCGMANYWAAKGWQVTLITLVADEQPAYELGPAVNRRPLGMARTTSDPMFRLSNLWWLCKLRRMIRDSRPQVVISMLERVNVTTLIATLGMGVPVIVEEQIDPAHYPVGRLWDRLRRWTYARASHVVTLTQRAAEYFPPVIRSHLSVIANPIVRPASSDAGPELRLAKPSAVAIGRLDHQKGFDLLLRAFARVREQKPEWSLTVLGEGPMRAELESLRSALGLEQHVCFPGWVSNPATVLTQADLFVMSSRCEGFPLALGEAMAVGLPVIAADCPTGPREMVRHEIDGLLVPAEDVEALAAAMDRLMSDESERKRLAARAPEVLSRFGLENVMGMWEELLAAVVQARSGP